LNLKETVPEKMAVSPFEDGNHFKSLVSGKKTFPFFSMGNEFATFPQNGGKPFP